MREGFHASEAQSKLQAEEGLAEYRNSPKSKEGFHPGLIENFETETAESPLDRKGVETEAAQFVEKHFRDLLPSLWPTDASPDVKTLIRHFDLTNEQIGLLGGAYFLREDEKGEKALYRADESSPDGVPASSSEITTTHLLALAWAKKGIRIDTRGDAKKGDSAPSHRYLLRSKGRYLSTNDYGMRSWDDQTNQMNEPDVRDITPFIRAMKQQFDRITENLSVLYDGRDVEARIGVATMAAFAERGVDANGPPSNGERLPFEEHNAIIDATRTAVSKEVTEEIMDELSENARDRELLFTGVSSGKVSRQLYFKFEDIARKYGLSSEDAAKDYAEFDRLEGRLDRLFTQPDEAARRGATIEYVESEFYDKPIIFGRFDREAAVKEAKDGVRGLLAYRAAKADPETAEMFDQYRCCRGFSSPYLYSDARLYDFMKAVGAEKAKGILASDDRDIFRQLDGWQLYGELGFDLEKMDPARIRGQISEAHKLKERGLWKYLEKREASRVEAARKRLGKRAEGKTWTEVLGVKSSRDLFFEGKRMLGLAQRVFFQNPDLAEGDKFHFHQVDWNRYDLSEADVSQEKIHEHLKNRSGLICSLLGESGRGQPEAASGTAGAQASLGLIVQALDRGSDIRGVALAYDKQRYLKGIIDGHSGDDLAFAVSDWPQEMRAAISQDEIEIYHEYADDYVLRDPNGLVRYAAWRASEEGRDWGKTFAERPESKGGLDFRLCLAAQTPEVRGWYKDAAEYVGGATVQNYLLRFNATRGTDGRLAGWHDVLFWVPNIRNLEPGEARSVLNGIQTMDDNKEFMKLLPNYSQTRDKFRAQGSIQSLRELKKRVISIESNLDLSGLPPEILDITAAPGFNLAALADLQNRANFRDLMEGRLDKEQPFKPHRRVFAGRPLTKSLKDGLGSHKMKIRGTAKDPKMLFHEIRQLIKGRKAGDKAMEVADLLENVPLDLEEEMIRLLQTQGVDIGPTVEAQVHAKSDPEGWVCGNYTDCCMPFGDYKNTDYMFNKSTQYFTIKHNNRIVAQSVVIDGRNRRKEGKEGDVVILDNIEVADNYRELSPLLARVYQTFWAEYTARPVKIGTGYSDLIPPGAKLEVNDYEPKTPVRYSDAGGDQIYDLAKIRGVESLDEMVTFANLTERDAELIAELETAIYPEGMAQGKAHIADILKKQRELEVPGAASSMVIRQGEEAVGYLLVLPEESEVRPGEKVAHVYDMAIHPKFQGKGLARQMMERVADAASAYGLSIEAEARASTSYAMLMNERVRQWFEGRGFKLTHNEKLEKYLGDENFYFVRFENKVVPAEGQIEE